MRKAHLARCLGLRGPFGDDFLELVSLRWADCRRTLAQSLRRCAAGSGFGPIRTQAIARIARIRIVAEQPLNTCLTPDKMASASCSALAEISCDLDAA